ERYLQNTRARRQTTDRCRGLPVTATGEREGAAQDDLSLDRPRDEIARRAAFAALDAEHIRSLRATLGSCPENGRSLPMTCGLPSHRDRADDARHGGGRTERDDERGTEGDPHGGLVTSARGGPPTTPGRARHGDGGDDRELIRPRPCREMRCRAVENERADDRAGKADPNREYKPFEPLERRGGKQPDGHCVARDKEDHGERRSDSHERIVDETEDRQRRDDARSDSEEVDVTAQRATPSRRR